MQKHKELYVALAILVLSITALGIVRADFEGPDNTPPTGDGAVITDGNGNIGIANTQDFRFNGIADANWRIGRNIDAFTESLVTGNAIEIAAHSSANEGFAIGANGGSSYYEILGSGPTHYFRGSVGIGDTSPATALEVNGTITATKLNVNTIDPIYTIDGERYATYVASMLGVKEEVTGVINVDGETTIDFRNQEKGSDLWLFAKVTNLEDNLDKMAVILTPSFEGDVWYEKNLGTLELTIHTRGSGEVSYRFTAPRFDWENWSNTLGPGEPEGLVVPTN